jgi:hypothetical protein
VLTPTTPPPITTARAVVFIHIIQLTFLTDLCQPECEFGNAVAVIEVYYFEI